MANEYTCADCGNPEPQCRCKQRTSNTLLPCPFCGSEAEVVRAGTRRQSTIIGCSDCGCRLESADEGDQYGDAWNKRVPAEPIACPHCGGDKGHWEGCRAPVDHPGPSIVEAFSRSPRRVSAERAPVEPPAAHLGGFNFVTPKCPVCNTEFQSDGTWLVPQCACDGASEPPSAEHEEEVAAAREALAEFNSESLAVMARRAAEEIAALRSLLE